MLEPDLFVRRRRGFVLWRPRVTEPAPRLAPPYGGDDRWPAAVVKWRDGELVPCDPDGGEPEAQDVVAGLPANNRTVYYKLPATWARRSVEGGVEVAVGTFADVLALVEADAAPVGLRGVAALEVGRAHLTELGSARWR